MINLKNEKGSVTVFVLVSCLFIISAVACTQIYMQSKYVAIEREYAQIKKNYEIGLDEDWEQTASGKSNIGDFVEYKVDLNGNTDYTDDWLVFYEGEKDDEEAEGRIYLIAADYVPTDNKILKAIIDAGTAGLQKSTVSGYETLSVNWPLAPTYRDLSRLAPDSLGLFMHKGYDIGSHTTNNNSKAVSTLLDTSIWNGFLDGQYGEAAIGGPTEEMWVKAWNKNLDKNEGTSDGFVKLRAGDINSDGYYISSNTNNNENYYLYMNGTTTKLTSEELATLENKYYLFYPHTSYSSITANGTEGNCYGYWLASPSSYYDGCVRGVDYGGDISSLNSSSTYGYGLRPVVCLKAGSYLVKDEEESTERKTVCDIKYVPNGGDGTSSTSNIVIRYSPSGWTDGTVNVSIEANVEGYELQYAVGSLPEDDSEWKKYSGEIPIIRNGTKIYARLWDGEKGGKPVTGTVANIDNIEPKTVSIKSTKQGITSIDVTASATDGDITTMSGVSGISKFEFYYKKVADETYKKHGEIEVEPTTTASVTYQYDGLENGAEYILKVKAYDQVNKETQMKESTTTVETIEIGAYVKYGVDLNGINGDIYDWQIFYKGEKGDEEAEGRIYLIAADYVPTNNNILKAIIEDGTAGLQKVKEQEYDDLCVNWSDLLKYKDLSKLKPDPIGLFMHKGYDLLSHTGNRNTQAVSELLDTSIWKSFLDETYGEVATGGPTLEMWVKAWNKKVKGDKEFIELIAGETTDNGYYVSSKTVNNSTSLLMNGTTSTLTTSQLDRLEKEYTVFFPHINNTNVNANGANGSSDGYWLASPSNDFDQDVRFVTYYGGIYRYNNGWSVGASIRPVVCLKDGCYLEKNEKESNEVRKVYDIKYVSE